MADRTPYAAGWRAIIPTGLGGPVPVDSTRKKIGVVGFSGRAGGYPTPDQCAQWEGGERGRNLAVRLGPDVVGIDIDHAEHRALHEGRYGPLPATWSSTSRGADSPRRILFYRIPPRELLSTVGSKKTGDLLGEVVQRHHRYAVVAPSVHPDTGGVYCWYDPDGQPSDRLPNLDELPGLPAEWLAALTRSVKPAGERVVHPVVAGEPSDADDEHDAQWCLDRAAAACKVAAETAEGNGFNDALNTAAFLCGRAVGAELMSEQDARDKLEAAVVAQFGGLDGSDEATIDSGLGDGAERPWRVRAAPVNAGAAIRRANRDKPSVHIGSPLAAVDWLRETIGTDRLSGFLLRDDQIVHTPAVGAEGYVPPADDRDHDGPAQVRPVTPGQVRARVQAQYQIVQEKLTKDEQGNVTGKTLVSVLFTSQAAPFITDAPDTAPNLRVLRGVTHTPLVRADGSVLDRPGYDQGTRLLFLPDAGLSVPEVPEVPTVEQVKAAVALLDEMTEGFPWAGAHDRANYYGLLLTPLLRELAGPPYKLAVFNAHQPGSGKSLLARLLRILHGGVFRAAAPTTEEEWHKQLSTILNVTTAPVVTFDNVTGTLKSGTLDGLLTSDRWGARQLGSTNDQIDRANDRLWTVTSNNASIGGDLVRRTMWVTIDPAMPSPELRTGFTIPDLPRWARQHRGELLSALLTLARAWVAAGRPAVATRSDDYAVWSSVVAGILTAAGVPGTFDAPASAVQQVSEDDEELAAFMVAAELLFGAGKWTVRELLATVRYTTGVEYPPPVFVSGFPEEALPGPVAEKHVNARAVTLGKWLGFREGRWADGRTIKRHRPKTQSDKTARWEIARPQPAAITVRSVDHGSEVPEVPETNSHRGAKSGSGDGLVPDGNMAPADGNHSGTSGTSGRSWEPSSASPPAVVEAESEWCPAVPCRRRGHPSCSSGCLAQMTTTTITEYDP